jgi:cytochrome c biogenesis protein CcdA
VIAAALIVAGIAIVDSLNPGTIGPALVLTASAHPVRSIVAFAVGFFVVNVAGGILLALGPGHWLFSLVPDPSDSLKHWGAVIAGIALVAAAVVLFAALERFTRPEKADADVPARRRSGSAFAFGAGLALVELPTALPYFAALAAIDAAHVSVAREIALIVLFNVLFLAPVFLIALLLEFFPSAWERVIEPVRRWMSAHWPRVLGAVLATGGVALLVFGVAGLSNQAG